MLEGSVAPGKLLLIQYAGMTYSFKLPEYALQSWSVDDSNFLPFTQSVDNTSRELGACIASYFARDSQDAE